MTQNNLPADEDEWRERIQNDEAFQVLRCSATERPGASPLLYEARDGIYSCRACGSFLFHSSTKYHSGSGWPSFWDADNDDAVDLHEDRSHGMVRTEVRCKKCKSHLGHLFHDGPQPTGLRYCINGIALIFTRE